MIWLFLILLMLFMLCFLTAYKGVLLTPQFGFVAGFLLQVFYGLFWIEEYELYLSDATFLVLAGGITLFVVVSLIVQYIGTHYRFKQHQTIRLANYTSSASSAKYDNDDYAIAVAKWKLLLFLMLQLFTVAWFLYFLMGLSSGSLSEIINYYRETSAHSDDYASVSLPWVLSQLKRLCSASGYFWSYLLMHSFIFKYKTHRILLALNVLPCILLCLLGGARGDLFVLVIAIIVQYYFMWGIKTRWRKRIETKFFIKILVICFAVIFSFTTLGSLIGRTISTDATEYIAIYLSAEIKNLDIEIRDGNFGGADLYNCKTLVNLVNWLAGRFGLPDWTHRLINTFQYVNGHSLGNVKTTFYAFLYDMGYFGVVFFTTIMAIISQMLFLKVVKKKVSDFRSKIDISLIAYSYIYFTLVFSFFSNKFYEMITTVSFCYYLLYWVLLTIFVKNVRLMKKKTVTRVALSTHAKNNLAGNVGRI